MKKIIARIVTSSLIILQFINVPMALSDSIETQLSTDTLEENLSIPSFSRETENSVDESSEKRDEDTIDSKSIDDNELSTEETLQSRDDQFEEKTEDENEGFENVEYESVFYNNEWFEFPVQKETEESNSNVGDNHELGVYTKLGSYIETEKINEKQEGRPKWDFIDVSSYQGEITVPDYEYMKENGVTGVVVKLTEGTFYTNPFAEIQIENALKAGLKVSTYHFSHYTTKNGAESEALHYVKEAKRLNLPLNTVMVNDLEKEFNAYSTQNAIFFANTLKKQGYENVLHYSSENAFSEEKLSASILGESHIWIAQYPVNPNDKNLFHQENIAWQWSDNMEFTNIEDKSFNVSIDYQGVFSNSTTDELDINEPLNQSFIEKNIDKYGSVTSKDFIFWQDLNFEKENGRSEDYFQQTIYIEKEYTLLDGTTFFLVKNNEDQFIGYINADGLKISSGEQGLFNSIDQFVTIKGTSPIWEDFDWTQRHSASKYKDKTVKAKGIYYHFSGARYLSLYDNQDNWVGYINENGVLKGQGEQGSFNSTSRFVTVKGTSPIWEDFNWIQRHSVSKYKDKTVKAKGIYYHFSGSRYLSLYDNQDNWIGYINENGTIEAQGEQGIFNKIDQYPKIKKGAQIWSSFNWDQNQVSNKYENRTVRARGIYYHFNDSVYLSIYDNKNNWIGYIDKLDTISSSGPQGPYHSYGKYVTLKGIYDIWDGFEWKNKVNSSQYKNQTFQANGIYYHFNGSTYLSLYDNNGKWLGYINENGTNLAPGPQGNYQKYNKYVTVKSENYAVWRNFSWTSKASGKFANKTYLAKGVYHHFNGSRYLSLYDAKDNWIGYINEKGTKLGQSQADKFKKVQELLNKEYNSKNFGIYVASLVDGSVAQINSEQQFHAASTGKLPALYYTQKMILDKKVDGNYPYTYTDAINQMPNAYMRGGAGVLQGQPYGKKFSLNTIMNWTAKYSDNQGTNFLAYYAANKYDATMKKEISRIMGRNWTAPFYVNAKDNAMMLEAIYHQGGKLITDLSNTIYDDQRIPKYLPVQVAHKIGDVNDLRHDAGIIYSNQPYTLSILTKNYQSYEQISLLSKKYMIY